MASADWHRLEAQPENPLIKIKHIYFEFFGITTQSNSYMILFNLFFKHPNQGLGFKNFFFVSKNILDLKEVKLL